MTTPNDTPRPSQPTRSNMMRKLVVGVSAAALLAGVGLTHYAGAAPATPVLSVEQAQTPPQQFGMPNFTSLVERVKPAVFSVQVDINPSLRTAQDEDDQPNGPGQGENPFKGTPFEHFFDQFRNGKGGKGPNNGRPQEERVKALGSGFFITADGYAVTNNHVVDGASKIEIVTDGGKTHRATIIGADPKTDLALLKVEGGSDFPFVKMAASMPKIGEWVLAVGNPYGLGGTVTAGIVSAENRDIGSGPYDDFIQIDAAVNRGNSGGPTFNLDGEVIGVNTAIFSPSGGSVGIAFDIPTTTVQAVIPVLRDKGRLDRAWLGVQIQPVTTDIAEGLGLADAKGAIISKPQADSPAEKAGLKAGDVITQVDGKIVPDARGLARMIGSMAPNTKAELTVIRDGKAQPLAVLLGELKDEPKLQVAKADSKAEPKSEQFGKLGLSVAPAPNPNGRGKAGVVVTDVDPAGAAADVGIQEGDVILKVGEHDISSAKDMRQALADAQARGRSKALALVRSGDAERYVALPAAA
ncbi:MULTISPECIES: Do family serine endopeptidase [Rhodomicrobium]|uniref:Do family serine endopeptidase n=1 Tax=Rhodomicrobium TaxID=1068 RepID=UPI000B4A6D89|nr:MULTISPECIES: Do family serine endopeptidase [Rhodomicrobium]